MNKERKNVVLHDWRSVEKTIAKRERFAAYQADSMARNASAGRPGEQAGLDWAAMHAY